MIAPRSKPSCKPSRRDLQVLSGATRVIVPSIRIYIHVSDLIFLAQHYDVSMQSLDILGIRTIDLECIEIVFKIRSCCVKSCKREFRLEGITKLIWRFMR